MHMYTHETFVPKMLKAMSNGAPKAKLLEDYGLTMLCQDTVGECLIKLEFKYDYSVKNYHMGGYEKKYTILYIRNFIDLCILLEWCMFRWIHMTVEDSEQ